MNKNKDRRVREVGNFSSPLLLCLRSPGPQMSRGIAGTPVQRGHCRGSASAGGSGGDATVRSSAASPAASAAASKHSLSWSVM